MHIVLPGALPDPAVALELAPHLTQRAPTLAHWFLYGDARTTASAAADTWCTPLEHWQLQARGFQPAQGQHISAGLGPLRVQAQSDERVWLAELVHMAPSRDGAALLTGDTLDIAPDHSQILLQSAREFGAAAGIGLKPESTTTWRVIWPALDAGLDCASPSLVAASTVNDWWPQAALARPWRQLVNTLQMAWFEHPVNRQREQAGLKPINSLWLYGGARGVQLTQPTADAVQIESALEECFRRQDWGGWIEVLARLERDCFAVQTGPAPTLTLTGRERYVTLVPSRHWWARLKARDWRHWWCNR